MFKLYTRLCLALLLTCALTNYSKAQLSSWGWNTQFQATENGGSAKIDYQLRLVVNTQALITAGEMNANGDDIRFADACGLTLYDHWVEKDINTDTTVIWVKVDSIPANGTADVYMFYGNAAAGNTSSFSATFPNGIITAGNTTLTGVQNLGYLHVNAGDTLFIGPGSLLDISARYVLIEGVIWGKGRGFASPPPSSAGNGPGGGGTSTNSGSGGGSYAGLGGLGGYDSGDTPGNGGPTYGTANSPADIDMGSSGGSAIGSAGGAGGGAISVNAQWVLMTGVVNVDGNGGQLPGGGQCGGGGAGGGIRVIGEVVTVAGSVSANGGDGSPGTITANDSGGGGGGGRIKAFWETAFNITTFPSAAGGLGGPYGNLAPGAPGGAGTLFDSIVAFNAVTVQTLASNPFGYTISSTLPGATICEGTPVTFTVSTANDSISFWLNGSLQQTGSDTSFTFSPSVGNDSVEVIVHNGCAAGEVFPFTTIASPATVIVRLLLDPCEGDTFELSALPTSATSYAWSTGESTDTIYVTTSGTYNVTVTNAAGCAASDTTVVNFTPLPQATLTQTGNLLTCTSGFVSYQWFLNGVAIPGATNSTYTASTNGDYYCQVGQNFCTNNSDTLSFLLGLRDEIPVSYTLYPNPTNGKVQLSLSEGIVGAGTIRIFDLAGKQLFETLHNFNGAAAQINLDLSDWNAGTYLLLLETPQGKISKLVNRL